MNIQQRTFDENGFLVLPGLFSSPIVDATLDAALQTIATRPEDLVVDNMVTGVRSTMAMTPTVEFRTDRFKVNDLHLSVDSVREMALSEAIAPILSQLLGQAPVLCNSLYFERGSAQPPHVDSLYMTPKTAGHLIAIWVALEDVHADAGPLEYFPASHQIPQMQFSSGSYHSIAAEMPRWFEYIDREVAGRGLTKHQFAARKGDVFIWHAHLLHGGGPINDARRTRKSFVFHYYSLSDCRGQDIRPLGKGYWLRRPPQPVGSLEDEFRSFSAALYLAKYPDVAESVSRGAFDSAWTHYYLHGRSEGRNASFSEGAYLRMHADVAAAVANRQFSSGLEHYLNSGLAEGRSLQ